jgi:hypothetical protein
LKEGTGREKGSRPPRPRRDHGRRELAARYAPLIYFDAKEPFFPLVAGYTVFAGAADSPSFARRVEPAGPGHPPAALVIEYAIWWDWDIGHLYELEHTWTYVGEDGEVAFAEASWHGGYGAAVLSDGRARVFARGDERHPVVYSEPGKHAFAPEPEILLDRRREKTLESCGPRAGGGGLLVSRLFEGILDTRKNPRHDALASAYLKRKAFVPDFDWSKELLVTEELLVPWPDLFEWIPMRIDWWLDQLERGAA